MIVKRMMIASVAIACSLTFTSQVSAQSSTHTVKKGDSLYKIANQYGIPVQQLKEMNNIDRNEIHPDEQLDLPVLPSESEEDLLARLVEAEAKGEGYDGKVAVATVVLNRVSSDKYPDSIYGVIYDGYQFSPVLNGTINQPASEESKRAVEEALGYQGYDRESLFFYNPDKATSEFLSDQEVTTVIGDHVFLR
ncbi:cell wall hydrolase [Halobacillus shinanisalinarum]|uniref:Cell wall hydrolase n=1 Tax=Halobacillus shinanisalinarum TaxID=2932258 RepID=A0ABY4GUF4_9BACI|nr:cell wall hydrolase [Halobacillus shinanisalinarum]UOQ91619.1 cell wall hydrolase [Halobacillus shinanisalinarum]